MKRLALLALPVAIAAFVGCTKDEKSQLKSDLDQTGDSAKSTLENAKDTAQQGVHDAAQNVADDTAQD